MRTTTLFASISALALMTSGAAYAQIATPPETGSAQAADSSTVTEVVVTGSRIARRDYVSASPIVTHGTGRLGQSLPSINVEASLNQLPQFAQGQNQSAIGAVNGGGRATLNLRGLGETRNLILLDGRRLPLSSAFGVVDVNIIPPSIVADIETISGGASAVYGSDAISGVVNFKTKRNFEGLEFTARHGQSFKNDADTNDFSVTGGVSSSGRPGSRPALGRLFRPQGAVGQRSSGLLRLWACCPRSSAKGPSFRRRPTCPPRPRSTACSRATASRRARWPTRAIWASTTTAPCSARSARRTTRVRRPTCGARRAVQVRQPVTMQEYIVQPMNRTQLFGKFDYKLNDSITAYAQFLQVRSKVTGQVGWSPTLYVVPSIPVTNPFIPAPLRTVLASRPNPTADFTYNGRFLGFEDRKFISDTNTQQIIVGFKGSLPIQDWTYDIYGSHDDMDLVETQDKALLLSKMRQLLYASDGGASICAGGFNPFGLANSTTLSKPLAVTSSRPRLTTTPRPARTSSKAMSPVACSRCRPGMRASPPRGAYRENEFSFDPDNARESNDIIGTSDHRAVVRFDLGQGSGDRGAGAAAQGSALRQEPGRDAGGPDLGLRRGRLVQDLQGRRRLEADRQPNAARRVRTRHPRAQHRRTLQLGPVVPSPDRHAPRRRRSLRQPLGRPHGAHRPPRSGPCASPPACRPRSPTPISTRPWPSARWPAALPP
jgi:iron complex outermembrane receptor protein